MSAQTLSVVIIDDNTARRNEICKMLPKYAKGVPCPLSESAKSVLKPDKDGNVPDLVIMNAEDMEGVTLSIFEWMREKDPILSEVYIPVILLVDDEFSDVALEFLDIDDAFFYEGEIEEQRFYSLFNEAIESEPVPREEDHIVKSKSPVNVIGKLVKAPAGSNGRMTRSAVLDVDSQLHNLELALERGRRRTEEIKMLLEGAQEGKAEIKESRRTSQGAGSVLGKIKKKQEESKWHQEIDEDDIPEEFRLSHNESAFETIENKPEINNKPEMNKKPKTDSNPAIGAINSDFGRDLLNLNPFPSVNRDSFEAQLLQAPVSVELENETDEKKPVIVIIDDDKRAYKLFKLFLSSDYVIVQLDSSMKAIDYFMKNTADIIFVDAVMSGMSGPQIIASIRWQNTGKNVPVVYMTGSDYKGNKSELTGEYVFGTIQKPIAKGALLVTLEQIKHYYRLNRK